MGTRTKWWGSIFAVAGVMSVGAVWSGPVAAEIDAGNRFCLSLSSTLDNGELAIVNLTPVLPSAPGDGQLVSSDVVVPPAASNVNFRPDVVDPNLAFVPVGSDGFACFRNSVHADVDLVADRIARLAAESFRPNPGDGGPVRVADTREGLAGDRLVPGERRCFGVPGVPGDVVVVNLTPVGASGAGHGALTSSEVVELPAVSNVNFSVGSVDPNVALAEIGADGEVCFHNSEHAEVDLVADVLLTIRADAFTSAPYLSRLVDTRNERRDVVECVTATRCYAAGDQFYRSDDGGVIWRLSESVAYLDRYDDDAIHCFDTDVCRYFGYWYYGRQSAGTSYMTLDGGLNWRRVGSLEWLAGLACPEADTCIAVGSYSNLITLNITFRSAAVTDDGGRTWRNISLPPASGPGRLTGITCSSATRCEAVSVVGTVGNEVTTQIVFESTDGWDTVTVIDP